VKKNENNSEFIVFMTFYFIIKFRKAYINKQTYNLNTIYFMEKNVSDMINNEMP